jgi:serine protease Do
MNRLVSAIVITLLASGTAAGQEDPLPDRYREVVPAVVKIHVNEHVARGAREKEVFNIPSQGSGVLISNDGKILTACHLVQTADEIKVEFDTGETIGARVIASEPAADVALLQLERMPADAKPVVLADSDQVRIGDPVFLIGAPHGLGPSLAAGHIGSRHKPRSPFGGISYGEIFGTDADIHAGNSGSPLFNMKGQVVGLVTHITTEANNRGLGFSVTSNVARDLLLDHPSMWTGIGGYWLSDGLAMALNIPQRAGLLVQRIAANSPASKLQLQAGTVAAMVGESRFVIGGDIILAVQGISLADENAYQAIRDKLSQLAPGDLLHVRVLRAGKQLNLSTPVTR